MATATEQNKKLDPAAHLHGPLVRVKVGSGYFLHWPKEFAQDSQGTRARGGEGYVLDWTSAHEREWCKGQEHKLEDVPDAQIATATLGPIEHPQAKRIFAAEQAARDKAELAAKQKSNDDERAKPQQNATRMPKKTFAEREG